jgi:hypothetical protein
MSKKHQATSSKQLKRPSRTLTSSKLETTIRILHEEWALNQGLRPKHQAASIKRQAASVQHLPRYQASDYNATSPERQALTDIPYN